LIGGCVQNLRKNFPIFSQKREKPLIYFDNAATTQKPQSVIDAVSRFYSAENANMNRGLYKLGEKATESYENVRFKTARFLNAQSSSEIIFTGGTTDSINMVAYSWGEKNIKEGDEIVVSQLEHHSNFVPWQQLALRKGAIFKVIPVDRNGVLDLSSLDDLITSKTKLVAVAHVSNALGIYTDLKTIIKAAKKVEARVVVDGAQAVPFEAIDVQDLGCDFYAFSGHKMLAPTGMGVLYIARGVQKECTPHVTGGGMVYEVDNVSTTFLTAPTCFEAGTPPIAQVIGFGAALNFLARNDLHEINKNCISLTKQAITGLQKLKKIQILGPVDELKESAHLVSFMIDGMHAHDVAAYLDRFGICVRAGHHCAQPLAKRLGYQASVRVSFYLYNTAEEVEYFLKIMKKLTTAI
jgi:cysteine desulfurase / selenocysteine lyase